MGKDRTFHRGGRGLIIGGLFLFLLGAGVCGVIVWQGRYEAMIVASGVMLVLFGTLMLMLKHSATIRAQDQSVQLVWGPRFAPKRASLVSSDLEEVVASESYSREGGWNYALYLILKEDAPTSIDYDGKKAILIGGHSSTESLEQDAVEVASMLGLKARKWEKETGYRSLP